MILRKYLTKKNLSRKTKATYYISKRRFFDNKHFFEVESKKIDKR